MTSPHNERDGGHSFVLRLDYLSCILTVGSTILVGRRSEYKKDSRASTRMNDLQPSIVRGCRGLFCDSTTESSNQSHRAQSFRGIYAARMHSPQPDQSSAHQHSRLRGMREIGRRLVHLHMCLICGDVDCATHPKTSTPLNIFTKQNILSSAPSSREKPGLGVRGRDHSRGISRLNRQTPVEPSPRPTWGRTLRPPWRTRKQGSCPSVGAAVHRCDHEGILGLGFNRWGPLPLPNLLFSPPPKGYATKPHSPVSNLLEPKTESGLKSYSWRNRFCSCR